MAKPLTGIKFYQYCLCCTLIGVICSCSSNIYSKTNKVYRQKARAYSSTLKSPPSQSVNGNDGSAAGFVGTVNFGMRKPEIVIIHHTAQQSCDQTLQTFTLEKTQVSAHYVICRAGKVYHMLNDWLRAWHAGASRWGGMTDVNSASIGIELDNNGAEPFSDAQIDALINTLTTLKKTYNINIRNFVGHGDIAPGRKVDPNILFPWKKLADAGFGIWYKDTSKITVPVDFNETSYLRIIGYDVSNITQARQAFRRHFMVTSTTGELNLEEKKVLTSLMMQSL